VITAASDLMAWKVPSRKRTELVAWETGKVWRMVYARYTALGIVLVTAYPHENQTKCEVVLDGVQYVCLYNTTTGTLRKVALLVNRFFDEIGVHA